MLGKIAFFDKGVGPDALDQLILLPNAPVTSPEGATISINGQQAGRGPIQKDLPPNQYTVRAELPGFQPSETRINVIAGYRQEITINLQALAGNSNYEKGIQFERQQLWPQAIASYQQALREDPNSESVYESLAQAYVKNGRYREAVDLLTVAAQKFPNNALILARRSRAQSAMRLGEDDLAASFGPQTGEPQPEEESGKKSKKSKKSKKKDEEAAAAFPNRNPSRRNLRKNPARRARRARRAKRPRRARRKTKPTPSRRPDRNPSRRNLRKNPARRARRAEER